MENKELFSYGDVLCSRSNSLLSRGIRWFMRIYKHSKITFSHCAVVINLWGELWIAEALAWGVRIWSLEQSGYLTNKQTIILRHKQGFSEDQVDALSKKIVSLGGTRYQYENLPQWIVKILLKIDIFRKSNERAIYCSELAAIAIDKAFPGTFPHPNITSPMDLVESPVFNVIDINNLLA